MVSFGNGQETQVPESNSPSSGARLENATRVNHEDDDDDTMGPDQSTVPLSNTLPVENFVETERMTEAPTLYEETQTLEDPDCDFDWVETQLLDEYENIAVIDNGDEGTQRTEVLSDCGGLSDDGATTAGARECGEGERRSGGEVSSKKRGTSPNPCSGAQGKKGLVVNSDASTDEEGGAGDHVSSAVHPRGGSCTSNNGSVRRGFTAVRAASLRSSGLAAAHSNTCKKIDMESSRYSNADNCEKLDHAGFQTGAGVLGTETPPNSVTDVTLFYIKSTEVDRDHETENSPRCMQDYHRDETKSRINNSIVKKLFSEMSSPGKEESTSKPKSIIGKADSPRSLVPDHAVAGLSYIESQEPGDLSQANALDVVDKFLGVNDLEASQEVNTGKTDVVKSPTISNAKGAQCLARKADHRSPVGKEGIFDWIDSLEDEGGGDFFIKRKDSLFESCGAQKSYSSPLKLRHPSSGTTRGRATKNGNGGGNLKTNLKMMSSDSRLMLHSSLRNEMVNISQTKTKKNLFNNMEQSDSKSLEEQLEAPVVDGLEEGICEVGPDTQIAAEAIEALFHGSPINSGNDAHAVAGKLTEIPSEGSTPKKVSSKNVLLRKRTFFKPVSEGILTRSKRRKMVKSRRRSPSSTRSNSGRKEILEGTIIRTKGKRGKRKPQENINARTSVNADESFISPMGMKTCGILDKTLSKAVARSHSLLTSNVQPSVSKELLQGVYHVNATPVAYRTRQSKAVNLLQQTEKLADGKDANGVKDISTPGAIATEDMIVPDLSGPLKAQRKSSIKGSGRAARVERNFRSPCEASDIEVLDEEEPKTISLVKDVISHPKRRRTSQISSINANANGNLDNPPVSVDGVAATTVKSSTRKGQINATIKGISETLDTAKRKKRSVSSHTASEIYCTPFVSKKVPFISGLPTKSSMNSPSFKPCLENNSKESHKADSINAATICSTSITNHSFQPKDFVPPKRSSDLISEIELSVENDKLEGLPKEEQPSGLACMTPSKDLDAASPVCVAQDPSTASCSKGLSIAKELKRLEATEVSPIWISNMRRRKDMSNVRVLFSHHLDEHIIKQQKKIMVRLGVPSAFSISDATHFVTCKFVRTKNMLEAMAMGKPVVTHMWLESCGQASCFIDEKKYILRDAKKEKEIGFSMPVSLARACQRPLLQDRRVYITPNVKPNRELISSLVKATHGQPMLRIGRSAMKDDKLHDDLLVLSCEEDYEMCRPLLEKGANVCSSELLLNGIVIQKLEYERHRLSWFTLKRPSRRRS